MTTRVLAAGAAVMTLAALARLIAIVDLQQDTSAWWFAAALGVAAVSFARGASGAAHRRQVLVTASAGVLILGLVTLPKIGVLLLGAGLLGLVAARDDALRQSGAAGP